jgi:hypothetical protein
MDERFKGKHEKKAEEFGDELSRSPGLMQKSDYQQEIGMEEHGSSTIGMVDAHSI